MMSSENLKTRANILKASWQLLEAKQGHGVRMSDIAKQAGLSRQAVYLHFPKRSELLIATTHYMDQILDVEDRLVASRTAISGIKRLQEFIKFWGFYIPEIYGVAKALIAMRDNDEDAAMAWDDRMSAVREGCQAAIEQLNKDGKLTQGLSVETATDLLWVMLSVESWEQFTKKCNWTPQNYVERLQQQAYRSFVQH